MHVTWKALNGYPRLLHPSLVEEYAGDMCYKLTNLVSELSAGILGHIKGSSFVIFSSLCVNNLLVNYLRRMVDLIPFTNLHHKHVRT